MFAAASKTVQAATEAILVKDYSGTASNYFSSVRIPASLIAGSALAALFSLVDKTKDNLLHSRSHTESIVLIIYHLLSIVSLLLSLNVIITSTSVAESIMFGNQDPMATSALEFMIREYEFEFIMTRWSFFVSLFCFLASVAARALLQFELLNRKRLCSALLILFSFGGLLFHLTAFVNERLFRYDNMGAMTWGVFTIWLQRSLENKGPCEMASILCFVCSAITAVILFLRSDDFSIKKADSAPQKID